MNIMQMTEIPFRKTWKGKFDDLGHFVGFTDAN